MGKYEFSDSRRAAAKKNAGPHPIWRGIGCLTIILIPIISGALAVVTVNYAISARWNLPYTLIGTPRFPDFVWKVPQLIAIFRPLTTIDNLYAILVTTFIYVIVLGGISSLGYAILYNFIGPPRYGPQDVPPPKIKTKPYKR